LRTKPMTGLSQEQLDLLIDRIADRSGAWQPPRGRRRALSLAAAVTMTGGQADTTKIGRGGSPKPQRRRLRRSDGAGVRSQASEFFQRGLADELPTKIHPKTGTIRIYDLKTNTFGAYNANGTTRTFDKPDPGMHGRMSRVPWNFGGGPMIIRPLAPPPDRCTDW
jgi:hypothetical protein